jgi:beta-aspartyl-peptidase (threonine type)
MTNKRFGRVGDSPIIGAGNYADNRTCAVSATGHGEYFIRANVAHSIASRMAFAGEPVHTAAQSAIADVAALGGTGGVIALARDGAVAMPFNTPGMYRGLRFSDGRSSVEIFGPSL